MRPEDLKNGKQLRTDFEVDGKGFEWRSDHRRGSEDADPHRRYHALRDKVVTFTPSIYFWRDRARVRLDRCFLERKW